MLTTILKLVLYINKDNKIANEYWEDKLKNIESTKLQNDESSLQDFIRDKYERRRYAKKGKDPMSLVIEGKTLEVTEREKDDK
jgi:hypothetical protein